MECEPLKDLGAVEEHATLAVIMEAVSVNIKMEESSSGSAPARPLPAPATSVTKKIAKKKKGKKREKPLPEDECFIVEKILKRAVKKVRGMDPKYTHPLFCTKVYALLKS